VTSIDIVYDVGVAYVGGAVAVYLAPNVINNRGSSVNQTNSFTATQASTTSYQYTRTTGYSFTETVSATVGVKDVA